MHMVFFEQIFRRITHLSNATLPESYRPMVHHCHPMTMVKTRKIMYIRYMANDIYDTCTSKRKKMERQISFVIHFEGHALTL